MAMYDLRRYVSDVLSLQLYSTLRFQLSLCFYWTPLCLSSKVNGTSSQYQSLQLKHPISKPPTRLNFLQPKFKPLQAKFKHLAPKFKLLLPPKFKLLAPKFKLLLPPKLSSWRNRSSSSWILSSICASQSRGRSSSRRTSQRFLLPEVPEELEALCMSSEPVRRQNSPPSDILKAIEEMAVTVDHRRLLRNEVLVSRENSRSRGL